MRNRFNGFVVLGALVAATACVAFAGSGQGRTGKVTPWDAMRIAETKAHGRAIEATYEFEDGKWGYSVMVATKGKLMEVELNAQTGRVGDIEAADPAGEAREFESDLRDALKH